jgi:TetR/AcrR family transcriptional regulator, transcriptional repressor for nem operon
MVRYGKTHSAETFKSIVDAASHLLREKGFADTSVPNVMKAVGLTHGGFYAHFEDKTEMLAAAMSEAFVQSPKNFEALAGLAKKTGDAGVIAEHYLSNSRVEDVATGCPAAALVSELPRQNLDVQRAFQQGTAETLLALAQTPGLNENDNAWAALSMLVGGLTLMRTSPSESARDQIRNQIIQALRVLAAQEPS